MKTFRSVAAVLTVLAAALGSTQGATRNWANSAGHTNWITDASCWDTRPTSNDVASFPNTATVNARPYLAGATNVNAILMVNNSAANSWFFYGAGTLTIKGAPGTASGYGIEIQSFNPRFYHNIVLGGPQTWAFTVTSGGPDVVLYGTLSGSGPLTISQPLGTWINCLWYNENTTAPAFTGGLNVNCGKFQWNLLGQSANRTDSCGLNASATGPGTITLAYGSGFGFNTTGDGVNQPQLTVNNPLVVTSTGGFIYSNQNGVNPNYSRNIFSGPIALNGPLGLSILGAGSAARFTGQVTLDRTSAALVGMFKGFGGAGSSSLDCNFEGNIVDGSSGTFTKPLVLRTRDKGQLYLLGAANTYAGGTVFECSGNDFRDDDNNSQIQVGASAQLGTGDALVLPGGSVRLTADANIAAGKKLRVQSMNLTGGAVASGFNATPTALSSDADGIFAVEGTFNTALAMSTVGNGKMFLGAAWTQTYSATSLSPCSDHVYRLGGGWAGYASRPALTLSAAPLTDVGGACSLQVGRTGHHGNITVTLADKDNTFSGDMLVTGQKMYHDFPGGSELRGTAQATPGQSPFGTAAGNVQVQNGTLSLYSRNGGQPVAKHKLYVEADSSVYVDDNHDYHYPTQLTFDSLVRTNRGTLVFSTPDNYCGTGEKLLFTTPLSVAHGIVDPPCVLCFSGGYAAAPKANVYDFASYESATPLGVQPLAEGSYTTPIPSPGTGAEIARGGGALSGNSSVWALKTTSNVSGFKITINGGGLLIAHTISSDVDFGTAEGIIYSYGSGATISGTISGSGGLTHAGYRLLISNTANDFTGQITLSARGAGWTESRFALDTAPATHGALGNANNPILLNGGYLLRTAGDCLLSTRTLTLGPLGGDVSGTFTIYGPVVGTGFINIFEDGAITLDSAANTYSGGTHVSGSLTVNAASSVGMGDVLVDNGSATFLGDNNISTSARLYVCEQIKGQNNVDLDLLGPARAKFKSASPHVGSLVGAGEVLLGTTGVDTILTVGEDNTSCAYYGTLRQLSGRVCGVTKAGSGTWTLYGAHTYTGTTTVGGTGKLMLMGSVAGNMVVNGGATLGSNGGLVGGNLTINSGGKLAVELRGDADFDVLNVTGTAALDGTLEVTTAAGYNPPKGTKWTILNTGGFSGSFPSISDGYLTRRLPGNKLELSNPPKGTVLFVI